MMQNVLKRLTFFLVLLFSLLLSFIDLSMDNISLYTSTEDDDNPLSKKAANLMKEFRTTINDPATQKVVGFGAAAVATAATLKTLNTGMKKSSSSLPAGRTVVLSTAIAAVTAIQINDTNKAVEIEKVYADSEKNRLQAEVRLQELKKASSSPVDKLNQAIQVIQDQVTRFRALSSPVT